MSIIVALVFLPLLVLTFVIESLDFLSPWLICFGLLWVSFLVTRKLAILREHKFLTVITLCITMLLPAIWGYQAYSEFSSLCENVSIMPEFAVKRAEKSQRGFLLDSDALRELDSNHFIHTPEMLVDSGVIDYVDYYYGSLEQKIYRRSNIYKSSKAEPASKYEFFVSAPVKWSNRWGNPLYKITYSVRAVGGDASLASHDEYILGGGLLGVFLQAIFADYSSHSKHDFNYLSCGYASKEPSAWRPDLNSKSLLVGYERTDRALLRSIIW